MLRLALNSIFISLFSLARMAIADEGMWPMHMLDQLPVVKLSERGLTLSPEQILNLKETIVLLGGGTGSFVSPEGLVLTNHHVAYGAIQYQSSAKENFIANGFLATDHSQELPATGYRASMLVDFRDVTREVLGAVSPQMDDGARNEAMVKVQNSLVMEAESKNKGVRAYVVDMLSGTSYYLFLYQEFKDVRLVYAPPASIGEYGGDLDNWVWPRHTGDFSFMRVYADRDGSPAEYAKENVPYRPKRWLKIAKSPVRRDDLVMVLGYPGNTMRYRSSYSIDLWQNSTYPETVANYEDVIRLLEEAGSLDRELAVRLAARIKGLNNGLKYQKGMMEGLKRTRLLEKKRQMEGDFAAFLLRNPELQSQYGKVLPSLASAYEELRTYMDKQNVLGRLRQSQALNFAWIIHKWHLEQKKPNQERDPGYLDRDLPRTKEYFETVARNYDEETDKKILVMLIEKALDLPGDQQIQALAELYVETGSARREAVKSFVNQLYAGTDVTDTEKRISMLVTTRDGWANSNDAMVDLASELVTENEELDKKFDAFLGSVMRLRPQLIRGINEWKGGSLYPDANRTLRLSYGTARGYSPRDAIWKNWATTLQGVVEKDTGKEPYNCPSLIKEVAKTRDYGRPPHPELKDLMVNFLADLDITGGSSGSPVLNGSGEIVGLAFDGNYEAMTSDFVFDPELTRTISVAIDYVLFITERHGQANNVLEELGI
jgi:hypothetical protein